MVYRSTNLGASWELANNGIPNDENNGNSEDFTNRHEFAYNPITGQMYLATSRGVYRLVYKSREN
jgi:hypothetical protein